jgi:hypothetical protein
VAERVMGLQLRKVSDLNYFWLEYWVPAGEVISCEELRAFPPTPLPKYDTNTSDAMEVFNHFPAGHIEKETCKIDGALYMVNIGGGYADTYSGNRSLCVAICLAALRAKGMTDAEIGEALK